MPVRARRAPAPVRRFTLIRGRGDITDSEKETDMNDFDGLVAVVGCLDAWSPAGEMAQAIVGLTPPVASCLRCCSDP